MSKTFYALLKGLLCATVPVAAVLTGCDGSDDTSSTGLILAVAPESFAAGEGSAVFTLMDDGTDVTASSRILNLGDNVCLEANTFTTSQPGTYRFAAVYGDRTSNTVQVEVTSSIPTTENYFRRVVMLKFTGTWCVACPTMTQALEGVEKAYPGRMALIAVHSDNDFPTDEGSHLQSYYGIDALPTALIDYRETSSSSPALLKVKLKRSIEEYPAVCGIAVSAVAEGGNVQIEAKVRFNETGDYKIACALTEDNLYVPGTSGSRDGYYHHVLRDMATAPLGDDIGRRTAGEEYPVTFRIPANAAWNMDECHVYVYVFRKQSDGENAGKYLVNNAAGCKVGESADFRYE